MCLPDAEKEERAPRSAPPLTVLAHARAISARRSRRSRRQSAGCCCACIDIGCYRSGVRPIAEILAQNPVAQDYVHWGEPGSGRWVTIYATASPTAHAFMVVAGLRLDTSHDGTDLGPNRFEDGPRWRVLDHTPTWAHWSVLHPSGL
jgi:hypothetical protein